MKNPTHWTKADLYTHLQHALELELWTIPLYLTALYSIKEIKDKKPQDYPDSAKLILSVVAQEMLHLELVCNISNALGHAPRFRPPVYDEQKGIPFIHPLKEHLPDYLTAYSVKPQALNRNSLCLFCAIELPHPKKEIVWVKERTCESIAELYEGLKTGIVTLWNECYVGDARNMRQKNNFKEYHNREGRSHGFSQVVNSPESALKAIDAIVEQGEGADSKQVPADFRPPVIDPGKEYDAGWYKGNLSHYQKFRILHHHHHKLPEVYSEKSEVENLPAQLQLQKTFIDFLDELEKGFNSDGPAMTAAFWDKMYALRHVISEAWEAGACPDFNF